MSRRVPPLCVAVVSVVLVVTACSGSDSPSASGGSDGGGAGAASTTTSTTTTTPTVPTAQVAPWKLPSALSRTACAVQGQQILCFSGLNAAKTSTPAIIRIDPAAGTVAPAGTLGTAVHDATGTEFGDRPLLIGGGAHEVGTTAVVDVSTKPPKQAGALPEPRSDLSSIVVDDRLVVLGGYDGTAITPGVLSSTDGSTFTRIGDLVTPVRYGAVARDKKTVYVFGGKTRVNGADSQTADIQAVDTATGKVTVVGSFPQPIGHAVAVTLGNQILVLGGRTGTGTKLTDSAAIWRFDPAGGTVTQVGALPAPLTDSTAAVVGDTAYLIGGERSATPLTQVVTVTLS
jgi:hypothetical protein